MWYSESDSKYHNRVKNNDLETFRSEYKGMELAEIT